MCGGGGAELGGEEGEGSETALIFKMKVKQINISVPKIILHHLCLELLDVRAALVSKSKAYSLTKWGLAPPQFQHLCLVQIRSGATILKTWYGCSIP